MTEEQAERLIAALERIEALLARMPVMPSLPHPSPILDFPSIVVPYVPGTAL